MNVIQAIQKCDEIVDLIDEDVPESAHDKAGEFFESVREGAVEMQETLEETQEVTPAQRSALENWEAGVRKWIH